MPRALRPAGAIDEAIVSPKKKESKAVPEPSPTTTPVADPAPQVISVTPGISATGVAITANQTATFDIAMTSGTLTSTNVELRDAANALVARTVTYNSTTRTVTIDPTASLAYSSVYTVRLKPAITSSTGVPLESEYFWSFTTTAAPNPAPTVQSTNPANGATSVLATANILVTFDQGMTSGTINSTNLVLRNQAGTTQAAAVTYDAATRTATINPTADMANSNTHSVTVTTGVQNADGLAMAAQYVFSFTTVAATPAPQVTLVAPLAGSIDRAVTVNAKATFDIALDAATVTTSTVKLRNSAGVEVAGVVTYDSANLQTIFDPNTDLASGTTFTCTLSGGSSGIKSSGGVPLAADYSWSFTTVGSSGLIISGYAGIAATPVVGGTGGVTYNVSDWAGLKSALEVSGTRIVNITGTAVINGLGDSATVNDPNITINGANHTRSIKRAGLKIRAGNIIFTNVRWRPSDDVTGPNSVDGLTLLPPTGTIISGIVIDRSSILWGPDIGGIAALNAVQDLTVQQSIIGCGLYLSDHSEATVASGGHSKGCRSAVPADAGDYGQRHSWIRNLCIHSDDRNFQSHLTMNFEALNNVVYNLGGYIDGNPQLGSWMGNIIKKGSKTPANTGWDSRLAQPATGGPVNYYASSVYFPVLTDTANNLHNNIGLTSAGALFTLTRTFGTGAKRTTPATGAPHNYTLVAADAALATTIINAAGPTVTDSIDQLLKDQANAGTGTWYNGVGYGAPEPSWP
jgi:hypothetical protein